MFRFFACVAVSIALCGCSGGKITGPSGGARARDYSPSDRIRVMLPAPSSANDAGARAVSQRVIAVLQQTHGEVALIPTTDQPEALAAAREAKAAYLICPTIEEWSDGQSPPFTADRITVRLDMRDAGSGEVVSTVSFSNISPLFSVAEAGPDALLDRTFDRAVTELVWGKSGSSAS